MICSALKPEFSQCEIENGISELLGENHVAESIDPRMPHGAPVLYIKLPKCDYVKLQWAASTCFES